MWFILKYFFVFCFIIVTVLFFHFGEEYLIFLSSCIQSAVSQCVTCDIHKGWKCQRMLCFYWWEWLHYVQQLIFWVKATSGGGHWGKAFSGNIVKAEAMVWGLVGPLKKETTELEDGKKRMISAQVAPNPVDTLFFTNAQERKYFRFQYLSMRHTWAKQPQARPAVLLWYFCCR